MKKEKITIVYYPNRKVFISLTGESGKWKYDKEKEHFKRCYGDRWAVMFGDYYKRVEVSPELIRLRSEMSKLYKLEQAERKRLFRSEGKPSTPKTIFRACPFCRKTTKHEIGKNRTYVCLACNPRGFKK